MKKFAKNAISYGAPALIVMIIGLVILAVQGIWPFGSETVDYYDMGQQVAAEYTQIWDELHGAKSSVFDWYLIVKISLLTSIIIYFNFYLHLSEK